MTSCEHRLPDRPGGDDPPGLADASVSTWAASGSAWPPATPTESWRRRWRPCAGSRTRQAFPPAGALVAEYAAVEVVVGLPRTLADRTGPRRWTPSRWPTLSPHASPDPGAARRRTLTTVTAQRSLREAGVRAKGQKAMIDQAAAVGILQTWLDQRAHAPSPEQRSGRWLTNGDGDEAATGWPWGHRATPAAAPSGYARTSLAATPDQDRLRRSSRDRRRDRRRFPRVPAVARHVRHAERLRGRRWQRRRGPGPQRRLHHRDRPDPARPRGGRHSQAFVRCRSGQYGDSDPARLLQGPHRDSRGDCGRAARGPGESGRASW